MYFTQLARMCREQEDNLAEVYNELTHYHFAIVLLLFEQDIEINSYMNTVREKAFDIVSQSNIINQQYKKMVNSLSVTKADKENQEIVTKARHKIEDLRRSIANEYQGEIFGEIRNLLEGEWRKQQYEATDMWKWKEK